MAFGPAEAFTPEQFAELYDANVLSTQRVNRAALPPMRRRGGGLLIWVSSSSAAGSTPPYLSPFFAAKAAMDAIAVQYARELSRWRIETSIVVPGAFTRGTNHFAHADGPADQVRATEYAAGPTAGLDKEICAAFSQIVPHEADPGIVAGAIAGLVDTPASPTSTPTPSPSRCATARSSRRRPSSTPWCSTASGDACSRDRALNEGM